MYDQAPINRITGMNWGRHAEHHEQHDAGGVRQLIADITELVELQAHLIADDARATVVSLVKPLVFIVLATVVLLGAIPVLILAAANVLVEYQQWSPQMAQFTCAGVALLLAVGLASLAQQKLKDFPSPLRRSLSEMEKNLDKLREMLVGQESVVERFEQGDSFK